ncbi:MAG: SagB/ThcOx family dehydrogenase, partial [Ignavibacteria bacterium]|nr:SagB/ThcOx family dehydrogenase [Ignavibacteria bacterium]
MKSKIISSIMIIALSISVLGQESVLKLPEPNRTGGIPVMEALQNRTSHRKFLPDAISLQQLSDLCWAAWGINRSETGKRTA